MAKITRHSHDVRDAAGRIERTVTLASATLVRQSELANVRTIDWQRQAWEYYDTVPELHFAGMWMSNALSRARFFIGHIGPPHDCPPAAVDEPVLAGVLRDFFDGPNGQAEMLRRVAVHLMIPGETFLIGVDTPTGRHWAVASSDELDTLGKDTYLLMGEKKREERLLLDPEKSMVMRLWHPHARQMWQADSPVRSLRGTLRELYGIGQRFNADIDSRLAGAGMLVIPNEATLPAPGQTEGGGEPLHDDPFVAELIKAMIEPIHNRDSASAVVPVVARVPAEAADAIKYISFATPMDAKLIELRDAAIRRVATAVDMPPEVMLGLSDVNHWNAWQISESAIKMHIEPMLVLLCDAITRQYLRPIIERDRLMPDPENYTVWFNTSDLATHTNKGPEAINLYNLGLVGSHIPLRENGFNPQDAPNVEEARLMVALQLAKQNPDIAADLYAKLGISQQIQITSPVPPTAPAGAPPPPGLSPGMPGMGTPAPQALPAPNPPTGNAPPTPGPSPGPAPGIPGATEGWLAAVEIGTIRALELVGRRLLGGCRSCRDELTQVPKWQLHQHIAIGRNGPTLDALLVDAYGPLREVIPDQPCVFRSVDRYVRYLIRNRIPHTSQALRESLAGNGCIPGVRS